MQFPLSVSGESPEGAYVFSLSQNGGVLEFEGRKIRMAGTPENPQWVAIDVCDMLEIQNVSQSLADFDEDERGICTTYTSGRKQTLLTVYEAGLYKLIFKSRKPVAKKFKKWVFGEVLPSLRKFGVYPPPAAAKAKSGGGFELRGRRA